MQKITGESLTIAAANEMLAVELEPNMWAFIVRMINYPELKFDTANATIMVDGYVPFKELAKEWVDGIANGSYDVRKCESCAAYFDINAEEGIYGQPEEFEEYICLPCAGKMTALDYYRRFIER